MNILWISIYYLQFTRPMSILENSAQDTALVSLNFTPTPREEAVFIHLNLMYT